MFRRRFVKEIRGRVFLDTNNNGFMDDSNKPLKDIGVTLFSAAAEELSGNRGSEIFVLTVKNFGELYEDICLIPANLENDRDGLPYTYSVSVLSL